jgi:IclR family transcriptional regulator, acetate operon repressor
MSAPSPDAGMRVVVTALHVLEAVSELQPVGVSALARATGIPKSSVQRCLVSLREAGWITAPAGQPHNWVLTGRALTVGLRGSAEQGLREAALAVMQDVRDETRETVHLSGFGSEHAPASAPDGEPAALVVIDRLDSPEPVRTWVRLGTRVPLHASCSGRAVLSRLPDAEVDRLLTGSLERFSAQTITDREALTTELREVRERGWAIADQSWRAGVGAVAAAVVGALGRPVGALAISVPQQRFGPGRESELGPVAVAAAERVSAALR